MALEQKCPFLVSKHVFFDAFLLDIALKISVKRVIETVLMFNSATNLIANFARKVRWLNYGGFYSTVSKFMIFKITYGSQLLEKKRFLSCIA